MVAVPLTLEDGAGASEPPAGGHVLVTPGPVGAYALTAGRFTRSLSRLGAWAVTEPLADHPLTARLVLRSYAAALADRQSDLADQSDRADRAHRTRPKPQSAE
ncbi:hypothetical protein [Streptomyces sp. CB01881]|uniref:hypothetical protein n=1 Tax=Streptomyces sp. CB01881 TaxID=2078691 RepID=UPI000CDC95B8|nr:hypothetical protein [Streptomyces sp. CB01881]AUY51652.1 hypothetical protein C2142_25025 [Streptomyces sp. CB01881]TYC71084.1 hypothetical protein EH183_25015 [Streptomyces sp. CB01881]